MKSLWIIFRKEVVDGYRDRRALTSALLFPLLGPILISVMLSVVTSEEELEGMIELPVSGIEHAPNLIEFMKDAGVEIVEPPEDPKSAVQQGDYSVVLRIPAQYSDSFQQSKPATVELILDDSKRSTSIVSSRIERIMQAYGGQVASLRLLTRGVSPTVVQPLRIEKIDMATPQTKASNILEMVGMFLIMAAFGCNMYIAIDASAGERERGSLEPLLIQPVPRREIVCGKWLATVLFGFLGGLLTLICLVLSMHRLPLENIGLRLVLGFWEASNMMLVAFPLIVLAGAAQLTLASFAKSFKEAQTYLSLTLMLPMIPGMLFSFKPMEPELWMALVPALGQQVMTTMILRGEQIPMEYWFLSAGSCFLLTVLSLTFCNRLFSSEHFFRK
jgi:sodium transport system permease protein